MLPVFFERVQNGDPAFGGFQKHWDTSRVIHPAMFCESIFFGNLARCYNLPYGNNL